MYTINVANFMQWRNYAKICLKKNISPDDIQWQDNYSLQDTLFEKNNFLLEDKAYLIDSDFKVPSKFIELAEKIACHRDLKKWHYLYNALWRIVHGEKNLLTIFSDPVTYELHMMYKAVKRDMHKMKAFVRFRKYTLDNIDYYVSWYTPQHNIIEKIAFFFKERFSVMFWIIFTPDGFIAWNGKTLKFDSRVINLKDIDDDVEKLWLTYYRATFNPARIKLKAMRKEMPVCYWSSMPETKIIQDMLLDAPQRVGEMLNFSNKLT